MKIIPISDLHYGYARDRFKFWPETEYLKEILPRSVDSIPLNEPVVFVLAGDLEGFPIKHLLQTHPNAYVIAIPGNHDYWWSSLSKVHADWPKLGDNQRCFFLEKGVVEIDEVVFLGTTLWTPIANEFGIITEQTDAICERRMFDFEEIEHFTPRVMREEHYLCRQWLETELKKYANKKVVVVTHHAPSFRSIQSIYDNDAVNPCYCVNMEQLAKDRVDIWIHGHLHNTSLYELGGCAIICNPYGYFFKDTNPKFNKELLIDPRTFRSSV